MLALLALMVLATVAASVWIDVSINGFANSSVARGLREISDSQLLSSLKVSATPGRTEAAYGAGSLLASASAGLLVYVVTRVSGYTAEFASSVGGIFAVVTLVI